MPTIFSLILDIQRLPCVILLGLFAFSSFAAEKDSPWPESPPKTREYIEVNGQVFPFFVFEQEVKPKPRPKVSLPKKARREGRGGVVLFGVIVNKRGQIESASIALSNTEADVEAACRKTLYRYGFPVMKIDDQPVDYAVMVPIHADATPFFGPK